MTYGVNAQQLPMYSQFYWNDFAINPAYTGLTGSPRIQLGYRNQWSGFSGSPSTFTLGGHTLLKKQNIGLLGVLSSCGLEIMGSTNPKEANEGTIRREFAESIEANSVHGSDSLDNAIIEISFFFSKIEIC